MSTVVFRGQQCNEQPTEEQAHWVCAHLKPIVSGESTGVPLQVCRILVGCNRSAEVFVVVSGAGTALTSIESSLIAPPLARDGTHITCGTCWVDLHAVEDLL
jgi:hypothetical protein